MITEREVGCAWKTVNFEVSRELDRLRIANTVIKNVVCIFANRSAARFKRLEEFGAGQTAVVERIRGFYIPLPGRKDRAPSHCLDYVPSGVYDIQTDPFGV